ncbi:MAG TPA: ferredoxin--NADP reductase [Blastocatellia bacterium]|nr:ferredoxin--NADP reductase [Blastocatellia bacterium]
MSRFESATIADRVDITGDLAIFRIASQTRLDFIPGQFATIAIEESGRLLQRAYSIVSAPHENLLEFFIELVPGGLLTPRLWQLEPGDKLLLRNQAAGAFLLDDASGLRRHLMIATVTGAAPFISMLRTYAFGLSNGLSSDLNFILLHGASHAIEFGPYLDELSALSREGWLTYVPTVSRPWDTPDWSGEVGRVDDILRKYADTLGYESTSSIAYACGHPIMIQNARAILSRAGYSKRQIHVEKYFTIKQGR